MARSVRRTCNPGSTTIIADSTTLGGGRNVLIRNTHASEGIDITGDENETADPSKGTGTTAAAGGGFTVIAGATVAFSLDGNEILYGRPTSTTNTITVHVYRSSAR